MVKKKRIRYKKVKKKGEAYMPPSAGEAYRKARKLRKEARETYSRVQESKEKIARTMEEVGKAMRRSEAVMQEAREMRERSEQIRKEARKRELAAPLRREPGSLVDYKPEKEYRIKAGPTKEEVEKATRNASKIDVFDELQTYNWRIDASLNDPKNLERLKEEMVRTSVKAGFDREKAEQRVDSYIKVRKDVHKKLSWAEEILD